MNELKVDERIKKVEEGFLKLLEENNLEYSILIDFPIFKILPPEVELSLTILNKNGAVSKIGYKEKEKK